MSNRQAADLDLEVGSSVVVQQRFQVDFDYPVVFARDLFAVANPILDQILHRREATRRQRALVCVDDGVAAANPSLVGRIEAYFHHRSASLELAAPPQTVPGGPAAKNAWNAVQEVMWTLGNLHLDRQSFVIAIGGGSMLDMVGFATAIVHRGLRLVRLPTTTLAQSDAGVGVKNGMDEHGQKNFVGTFAPPFAVLNDSFFLRTLADEHWLGGVAEAIKVAAIKDAGFFDYLSTHANCLAARDGAAMQVMEAVVRRSAELHLEHIRTAGDPFEMGSSRPLDFGHWAAHKIETLTHYGIAHGQAVAIGIAIDAGYAMRKGLLPAAQYRCLLDLLRDCGLPCYHPCLRQRQEDGSLAVLAGLRDFREHLGGILCVALPNPIGAKIEVHQIESRLVEETIDQLARETD